MVSCCAHVLGLRWRKNVDSGRGVGQRSSFPGWLVINCFVHFLFFLFFFYEIFFFPFFETLNGTRRLPLGESWEIPPLFFLLLELKSLLCRQGSLFVKSQPSSHASSPRPREISGLGVPPSTPFSQQQASCGLIGPSTSRHSKWGADSYRFREFSPPPPWTVCFKIKQGNMCQQVSPNDSSSRLWDRICKYNSSKWKRLSQIHLVLSNAYIENSSMVIYLFIYLFICSFLMIKHYILHCDKRPVFWLKNLRKKILLIPSLLDWCHSTSHFSQDDSFVKRLRNNV